MIENYTLGGKADFRSSDRKFWGTFTAKAGKKIQGSSCLVPLLLNPPHRPPSCSSFKMSTTDPSPTIPPSAEGVDRPLTNKEKRQLAVAEKRKAKEVKSSITPTAVEKRKREDDASTNPLESTQVEQVLSHKEQRRRKKIAKLSITSSDPSDSSGPNALMHPDRAAGSPSSQTRSDFSIWIGNLSFFTPPAKLIDWFNTRGVDGISRVNMPKGQRRAEMNRGFCYLDLPNKDMLTAALNLSEQPLDGRKLLIKDGSDFTGRPDINSSALGIARTLPNATNSMYGKNQEEEEGENLVQDGEEDKEKKEVKGKTGLTKTAQKILRAQKNPASMTLFLGNLSFNTTEQGVRELFDHSATKRNPVKATNKSKSKRNINKSTFDSSSSSDSESDSESEEEKEEDKKKDPTAGDVVSSAAGIRKVRLGTFQDAPSKCKGFGFLDFHTIEQATASLIDPRNSFLDGRKIIVQYASADATRRGASKTQKSLITNTSAKKPNELKVGFQRNKPKYDADGNRIPRSDEGRDGQRGKEKEAPVPGSFNPNAPLPKKHKETKEERIARRAAREARTGEIQKRARPGAALANAQRASFAVVESTGTKVTFDD